MTFHSKARQPGVLTALGSAFLFGTGTPLAKSLLDSVNPWMLTACCIWGRASVWLFTGW